MKQKKYVIYLSGKKRINNFFSQEHYCGKVSDSQNMPK